MRYIFFLLQISKFSSAPYHDGRESKNKDGAYNSEVFGANSYCHSPYLINFEIGQHDSVINKHERCK